MAEYYHQNIEIIVDKESELYRRICAAAEKNGISVERVFSLVAEAGICHHMGDNLKYIYERGVRA